MCEQRTLRLDDGSIVYCYDDGKVEFVAYQEILSKRSCKGVANA